MKHAKKNDVQYPAGEKSPRWMRSESAMSEEEIAKIRDMNWEWYYNCYLFRDEPISVACKVCGVFNNFLPREMKKKCNHCGVECRRCEVDEDKKEEKAIKEK